MVDAYPKSTIVKSGLCFPVILAATYFVLSNLIYDRRSVIRYFTSSTWILWSKSVNTTRPSDSETYATATVSITTTTLEPEIVRYNSSVCPPNVAQLVGYHHITDLIELTDTEMEEKYKNLSPGGQWRPNNCSANQKLAVVIPFRDRDSHLRLLLDSLHTTLQRQQLDYRIVVVEQAGHGIFNRGFLLNVGYMESAVNYSRDCFVFHDVDLLPENDRNIYRCRDHPQHLSPGVDKFGYKLPYKSLMGGVTAFTKEQFQRINGFPTMYWGWGGEDDDLFLRVNTSGYKVLRPDSSVGRYKMIPHAFDADNPPNPARFRMLDYAKNRLQADGLTSLNYTVIRREHRKLYTKITVDIHAPSGAQFHYERPEDVSFWRRARQFAQDHPVLVVLLFILLMVHIAGAVWLGCAWLVTVIDKEEFEGSENRWIYERRYFRDYRDYF